MKYRKKPVVIEAYRVEKPWRHIAEWCGAEMIRDYNNRILWLSIPTLEGRMRAELGDFIIKGIQGEFYPCKPDIFAQTYEPVDG